ncbi:unnamed protein product [Parnassius apollo]|uniref:(apollo) hypothetical protein n=1 Tax=Parnassius apollo TaxID=110799 RepID=A0A8S3W6I4_PARAO|nr:unnamed protein product [Parnassius apollo]
MDNKKISFGFLKTKKQDKPIITEQREYIESVEDNSIKIVGKEVTKEAEPLIIPMKPNTLITAEKLREIAEKVENSLHEPEANDLSKSQNENQEHVTNETLDQMAVRELLQEAKKEKTTAKPKSLQIPVPSLPVIDGQKESSLDDYESIPIKEFGMAMLRGMGWTPDKETSKYKPPQLRPKGLGLGADKVIAENQKKNNCKDNDNDLSIVKNACVKVTSGKYSGCYGKVVSLDEDNGRVMVNIPVKKETVSLSEFMMQPVTKSEFDKQSKVINADSYEAYKKNEKVSQKTSDYKSTKESSYSHKSNYVDNKERREDSRHSHRDSEKYSNGKNKDVNYRQKQDSSSSEGEKLNQYKKTKKRYSSSESLSSDTEKRRRKKKEHKRYSSSDSEESYGRSKEKGYKNSNTKEKRDIDKKRKGKKKKRDRDRSPNYRKHRK